MARHFPGSFLSVDFFDPVSTLPMSVALRDLPSSPPVRAWLRHCYSAWLRELGASEADARASDSQLAALLASHDIHVLLIERHGEQVGFAFVQRGHANASAVAPELAQHVESRVLAESVLLLEFYVTPAMRRLGIGRSAARLLFDRFVGRWEIKVLSTDLVALNFWRRALAAYAPGGIEEIRNPGEIVQRFLSRGAR